MLLNQGKFIILKEMHTHAECLSKRKEAKKSDSSSYSKKCPIQRHTCRYEFIRDKNQLNISLFVFIKGAIFRILFKTKSAET